MYFEESSEWFGFYHNVVTYLYMCVCVRVCVFHDDAQSLSDAGAGAAQSLSDDLFIWSKYNKCVGVLERTVGTK